MTCGDAIQVLAVERLETGLRAHFEIASQDSGLEFWRSRVGEVGSVGEELSGNRGELLVELEDPTMTGVGVDDQLAVLDAAMQVL